MIGTLADAAAVLAGEYTSFDRGTTRVVYRVGDVVYKVAEFGYDNVDEYENYLHFRNADIPEPLALPEFTLWDIGGHPVIAMPFISGTPMSECFCFGRESHDDSCLPAEILDMAHNFIDDTGGMNIIFDGSTYWLIDIAC